MSYWDVDKGSQDENGGLGAFFFIKVRACSSGCHFLVSALEGISMKK